MPGRLIILIFFCCVFGLKLDAQQVYTSGLSILKSDYSLDGFSLLSIKSELDKPSVNPKSTKATRHKELSNKPVPSVYLPTAWCYEELAVFCKLEVKIEKSIKLPVKFRIGEVNYAEMREGKPYSPPIY